ncbi:MAG: hypothetical protein R3E52_05790 [Burkholderiaceae bacterium]
MRVGFKSNRPLALVYQAQSAIKLIVFGGLLPVALLAGCASLRDAPRLAYQCPEGLSFEARLYQDMALLDGQRGHAVLERLPHRKADELAYADPTLTADFGLGIDRRLVRLSYAGIPEAVTCTRVVPTGGSDTPVRAAPRRGPRNPPPFDPDAPIQTNIRTGDGNVGPG